MFMRFSYFLVFVTLISISTKNIIALELDILCVMKSGSSNNEFEDLIVSIDSNSKTVALGGFKFNADEFIVSDSNIKWSAKSVENMYDSASGFTSGTLGRFSGNLSLVFQKHDLGSSNEVNFQCEKFKMKNRKF